MHVCACVFPLIGFKMHDFNANKMLSAYPINVFIQYSYLLSMQTQQKTVFNFISLPKHVGSYLRMYLATIIT